MGQKNRGPLHIEALEDRWVPATVKFVGGTLLISNPTVTAGAAKLTLNQTANNTWQVVDGAATIGTYANVGNLIVTGSNAKDSVAFNLNAKSYSGNLLINAGNGNDSVALNGGKAIAGNATVLTGNGNDTVNVFTTGATTVGGNLQILNTTGSDGVLLGSGTDTFAGNVTVTGAQALIMFADPVGGSLTINSQSVVGGGFLLLPNVGKDFTFTTGSGADTILMGATVGGNSAINLGDGNNNLQLVVPSTFNGNLNFLTGSGSDTVTLVAATGVSGNAAFNLGEGDNTFNVTGALTAQGNLSYLGGNGVNAVSLSATSAVGGNLSFQLGNGNDTVTAASSVGGTTFWRSGNGADNFTLGSGANNYNVFALFGNSDDTFTLATTGLVTGLVDGGGRILGNVFNQGAATLASTFTLRNFP